MFSPPRQGDLSRLNFRLAKMAMRPYSPHGHIVEELVLMPEHDSRPDYARAYKCLLDLFLAPAFEG